jgi:hypothetical protein
MVGSDGIPHELLETMAAVFVLAVQRDEVFALHVIETGGTFSVLSQLPSVDQQSGDVLPFAFPASKHLEYLLRIRSL